MCERKHWWESELCTGKPFAQIGLHYWYITTLPARHCTAGINLRECVLLHRQAQKTFPVWRQREALPCGLEALHQALTAQTSSLDHQFGARGSRGWGWGTHSTLFKWTPRRDFEFYFIIFCRSQLYLLSLIIIIIFFLITQLFLFFSCPTASAPNSIENLPRLIYTEELFRLKAAAPFSQAPLCYPVFLFVIIKCFLLNACCEEVVLKCMQQMMVLSERGFWKLREPRVIISKRLPSKRQVYPEVLYNQSWF